MIIDLISVSTEDKGKYKILEAIYKSEGKAGSKKIMSFGAGEGVFKYLSNAQPGQYDVKTVKNDKGYWDWVDIKPSNGVTTTVTSTSSPKSTYETPEERAKKQVYIVRQSSISSAIEFAKLNTKKVPAVEEIVTIAKLFEDYVFGVNTVQTSAGSIAELADDIPL